MISTAIYIIAIVIFLLFIVIPIYYVIRMGNPKILLSNILYAIAIIGFILCGLGSLFILILVPLMNAQTLNSSSTLITFIFIYVASYILIAIGKKIDRR